MLSLSPTPPAFISALCFSFLSLICLERSSSEGRGAGSATGFAGGASSGPSAFGFEGAYFVYWVAGAGVKSGLASLVTLVALDLF